MARGINKVILVGNCGKDPEVRYLPSGGAVANLTIATSESWTDKATNEKKEKTEWHNLVFFGKIAEIVGQYIKKGSQIYVEGKLQTRKWEKDGVDRYSTEIVVSDMQMLGGVPKSQADGARSQRDPGARTAPAAAQGDGGFEDDDIPF